MIPFICFRRNVKLDWMYSGSTGGSKVADEDYLLGKKKLTFVSAEKTTNVPFQTKTANLVSLNPKDLESKFREDPLTMIKRKEMEVLRKKLVTSKAAHKNPAVHKRR